MVPRRDGTVLLLASGGRGLPQLLPGRAPGPALLLVALLALEADEDWGAAAALAFAAALSLGALTKEVFIVYLPGFLAAGIVRFGWRRGLARTGLGALAALLVYLLLHRVWAPYRAAPGAGLAGPCATDRGLRPYRGGRLRVVGAALRMRPSPGRGGRPLARRPAPPREPRGSARPPVSLALRGRRLHGRLVPRRPVLQRGRASPAHLCVAAPARDGRGGPRAPGQRRRTALASVYGAGPAPARARTAIALIAGFVALGATALPVVGLRRVPP